MQQHLVLATAVAHPSALRTVLVCDVVDSVRWMQADEAGAIKQWQAYVEVVKSRVIPQFNGRLVKSLGDGLMLDFEDEPVCHVVHQEGITKITPNTGQASRNALHAAFAMQAHAKQISKQDNFSLRIGLHHTMVTLGDDDIYGMGVNLCARITALAGPGEIVLSVEMRDQITDQLDADLQDMGDCYLKHVDEPVRVFRAGPAGPAPMLVPTHDYAAPLQTIVAVIPFTALSLTHHTQFAVGDIIAEGVIGQLSRTPDLKVISRLSTSVFRNRHGNGGLSKVAQIESHLRANYVLSGSYIAKDKKLIVTAELSESKTKQIIWMDRLQGDIGDLLQMQSELCHRIANATHMAILDAEVKSALTRPLSTLESCTLLLGGISMMYRTSKTDFFKSQTLFTGLMERNPKDAVVPAWLAFGKVLQINQGWAGDQAQLVSKSALELSSRALNLQSNSSFALVVNGLVSCHLQNDFEKAQMQYQTAIDLNPNEAPAWLYQGLMHALKGEGDIAVRDTLKACELSPLDPYLHFNQSITAAAYMVAADYEKSIELAKLSLKTNAMNTSTRRILTMSQVMAGHIDDAKISAKHLLLIEPGLTVSNLLSRMPGSQYGVCERYAAGLRTAGVPG